MLVEATGSATGSLSVGMRGTSLRRGVFSRILRRPSQGGVRQNDVFDPGLSSFKWKNSRLPVISEKSSSSSQLPVIVKQAPVCQQKLVANGFRQPLRHGIIGVKGVDPVNLGLEISEEAEIYTDWANHYLEKSKFRRFIQDLQVDLADGVLLADIIEAVACEKVRDVNRKPKSASQMMDNINACLTTLVQLGVSIDGLTARDIKDGNLKAILGVFFGLSRHKQHQKQLQQETTPTPTYNIPPVATQRVSLPTANSTNATLRATANENHAGNTIRQTTTPASRPASSNRLPTAIPTPHTTAATTTTTSSANTTLRRSIPTACGTGNGDARSRGLAHSNLSNGDAASRGSINARASGSGGGSRVPSACSSRSTSPSGSVSSLIPQPTTGKGQGAGSTTNRIPTVDKTKCAVGANAVGGGGSKLKSAKCKVQGTTVGNNVNSQTVTAATFNSQLQSKNSMLDKFKFFNTKDKVNKVGSSQVAVSQRTSSSSGFSSAKSDSSPTSLCSETKSLSNSSASTTAATITTPNGSVSNCSLKSENLESKVRSLHVGGKPLGSQGSRKPKISKSGSESNKVSGESDVPVAALNPDNPVRESKIANLTVYKTNGESMSSSGDGVKQGSSGGKSGSVGTQCVTVATSTTSIPKPTAAVKGTTKVLVEEHKKSVSNGDMSQLGSKSLGNLKGGCKKADGCSQVDINQLIAEGMVGGDTQLSTQMIRTCKSPSVRHDTAVAMVSPMLCDAESGGGESILIPLKGGSESGGRGLSSRGSGRATRCKMETTFDPTDKVITRETQSGRETTFSEDPEDMVVNIKPMQPILRANSYGYVRHLSASGPSNSSSIYNSPRAMVPGAQVSRLGYPAQQMNGNGRHMFHGGGNSGDLERHSMDHTSGYLSDGIGSLLGEPNMCGESGSGMNDIASGYMSESAVALSPRRPFMHTRFKETMSSTKEGKMERTKDYHLQSQNKLSSVHLTHPFSLDDTCSVASSSFSDSVAELHQPNHRSDSASFRQNADGKKDYSSLSHHKEVSPKYAGVSGNEKRSSPKCKRKTSSSGNNKGDGGGRNEDERHKAPGPLATDSPSSSRKGQQAIKPCAGNLAVVSSSGSRRPNSTCSATSSAGSSSKSGSSRSKKSTLFGLEGDNIMQDGGGSTAIPRPGSAASCRSEVNTRSTLEKKSVRYASKMATEGNSESHRYQHGDIHSYGHGSLGRRLPQNSHGSPHTRDLSSVISNSHSSFSSRSLRPLHSKNVDSASDISPYTYGDSYSHCGSPYSWLGRNLNSSNGSGGRLMGIGGSLTEAESMESLVSNGSSSIHAQIQHARANSLTQACLALHQRNQSSSNNPPVVSNNHASSPRLARSNSIRSTKSEKLYPSMLRRSDEIDNFKESMESSTETHRIACRRSGIIGNGSSYPLSLLNGVQSANSSPCHMPSRNSTTAPSFVNGLLYKISPGSKDDDDDLHGSQLSLASVASSLYSSVKSFNISNQMPEEKHNHEIRKLRRELADAHDKVHTLTSQLTTNGSWSLPSSQAGDSGNSGLWSQHDFSNAGPQGSQDWQAHVVAAFEQSLANMTNRLQTLTQTAERKDSELNELRGTIESLKKHSVDAGLTSANFSVSLPASPSCNGHHYSQRSHPRTSTEGSESGSEIYRSMNRQLSTDSMSSVNSISSTCSATSHRSSDTCNSSNLKKKKKIGWLRSSFSKAFSKSKRNRHGSVSDVEDSRHVFSDTSVPNSPLLGSSKVSAHIYSSTSSILKPSLSSSALKDLQGGKDDPPQPPEAVHELKKQLREKERVLTDIRLEALSSAHQLESLKDTVNRMRNEMVNLKHDNERLQRLVTTKSLTSSQSSLQTTEPSVCESANNRNRLSSSDISAPPNIDSLVSDGTNNCTSDGKRVTVSVFIGRSGSEEDPKGTPSASENKDSQSTEVLVGAIFVSGKTRWDMLDVMIRRIFKEYVLRVDPSSNLGLNSESVNCYNVGEIMVTKEFAKPELLPCGYLVGENTSIKLTLKGMEQNSVDSLAFHTLIPKSIVHRYMSLLNEHRRIILCGPSGTGKTFLAHRLAEYLVLRSGKQLVPGSVATFHVDHRSAKELRQYLSNVAEQCEGSNAADLPSVIILDNLHHVGSLGEVFNGFLSAKYHKCPYIIGTMNQATCSTTNLQLHHNFRWVLCANHMEPVKGFLGRYLRRKLMDVEIRSNQKNADLVKVVDWFPRVWQQLNTFLETHSSSDVTIGPRLFLSCPIDVAASQVWFTDLWNYSVVPYLLEAVREGLQLYGRRAPWEDPTEWVIETYPWPSSGPTSVDWPSLLRLRPEDVGYEGHPGPGGLVAKSLGSASNELEGDPLLNMLMRLQEAASYSSPHSNDSDSLDSHESGSVHTEDSSSVSSGTSSRGVESTL